MIEFFHKRSWILKALIAIVVIVILFWPLQTTFKMALKYFELKDQIAGQIAEDAVTSFIGDGVSPFSEDKKILDIIQEACLQNMVAIESIEPSRVFLQNEVLVESQEILLEGSFVNVLKSLSSVGNQLSSTKVTSIKFERREVQKRVTLTCSIVFQSVKLKSDEDD